MTTRPVSLLPTPRTAGDDAVRADAPDGRSVPSAGTAPARPDRGTPPRPTPPGPGRLRPPTRSEMVAVGLRVLAHLGRGCATAALVTGAPVDIRIVSTPPATGGRPRP